MNTLPYFSIPRQVGNNPEVEASLEQLHHGLIAVRSELQSERAARRELQVWLLNQNYCDADLQWLLCSHKLPFLLPCLLP